MKKGLKILATIVVIAIWFGLAFTLSAFGIRGIFILPLHLIMIFILAAGIWRKKEDNSSTNKD